jgi:hypothetical protein
MQGNVQGNVQSEGEGEAHVREGEARQGGVEDELGEEELRQFARVKQWELNAVKKSRDAGQAKLQELQSTNARLRVHIATLLAEQSTYSRDSYRTEELQFEVDAKCKEISALKTALQSARAERDELAVQLQTYQRAASASVATPAAVPGPPAALAAPPSRRDGGASDWSALPSFPEGGFAVSAEAARRIAGLVRQITGAASRGTGEDMVALGLASAADAQHELEACLSDCRATLRTYYSGQGIDTDADEDEDEWGALLAACLGDVVFADGLVVKTWKEAVGTLQAAAPHRVETFPLSAKAGCLLSYLRTHLPGLVDDAGRGLQAAARAVHDGAAASEVTAKSTGAFTGTGTRTSTGGSGITSADAE